MLQLRKVPIYGHVIWKEKKKSLHLVRLEPATSGLGGVWSTPVLQPLPWENINSSLHVDSAVKDQ